MRAAGRLTNNPARVGFLPWALSDSSMTIRTPDRHFRLTGFPRGDRIDALSISGHGLSGVTSPNACRPNTS